MSCRLSVIVWAASLLLLITGTSSESDTSIDSLRLVVLAHRHGDRTPIRCYPADPFGNASFWPDGWGELTMAGKKRLYTLGQYIRKRYTGFLGDSPREVHIRSSAAERCLESTALLMAGAYPPEGRWVWKKDFPWQPVPIQTEPRKVDGMLNPSSRCPAAEEELSKVRRSPEVQTFTEQYKDLFSHLTLNTGANITDIIQAENVYDTLFIEGENNMALPPWVDPRILTPLKRITDYTFYFDFSTKLLQRLRAGLFFKDLRHRLSFAVNGVVDEVSELTEGVDIKKMFIYSTHDSQISAILNAMGVFNMIAPPYASTIIFELHQINQTDHLLKLFYLNDTYSEKPIPLAVPGCAGELSSVSGCHLGKFFHAIEDIIPDNWRRECQLDVEPAFGSAFVSYLVFGSSLGIVMVAFLFLVCVYFKRVYGVVDTSQPDLSWDYADSEDDEAGMVFPRGGPSVKNPMKEFA